MSPFSARLPPTSTLMLPKSFHEIQRDILEWICHVLITTGAASTPEQVRQLGLQLEGPMGSFRGENALQPFGRVQARLQVAALAHDLAGRGTQVKLDTLTAKVWEHFRTHLGECHALLIRNDTDVDAYADDAKEDDAPHPEMSTLPMFTQDYQAALALIDIQGVVAQFRQTLTKLQKKRSKQSILKDMEQAIDTYKAEVAKIPTNVATSPLTAFLIADLYHESGDHSQLCTRLLDDLNEVVSDEKQDYSWSNTREQLLYLLKRWYQRALVTTPKLVECGYGGVSAIDDNMSVSSWGGGANEEDMEPLMTQPPEPPRGSRAATSEDDDMAYMTADEDDGSKVNAFAKDSPMVLQTIDEKEEKEFTKETPIMQRRSRRVAQEKASEDSDANKENAKQSPRRSRRLKDDDTEEPSQHSRRGRKRGAPEEKTPDKKKTAISEYNDEEIDSPASSQKAPISRKKSRSAKKSEAELVWSDDSGDEAEKVLMQLVRPSMLPTRVTHPHRNAGATSQRAPKKRRFFTEKEKETLKAGVRRYGRQWELIRHSFKGVLSSRSGVSLKDCWRNMEANGEV